MQLVDQAVATVVCVKVPGHCDIPGNEKAYLLAEQGRKAAPLHASVRTGVTHQLIPMASRRPRVDLAGISLPKTGVEVTPFAMMTSALLSHSERATHMCIRIRLSKGQ